MLTLMISNVMYCPANVKISFFVVKKIHIMYTYIFFIHSYVDGHLGLFNVWGIVTSIAITMNMQVFLQQDLESFRYILRTGIAGSYSNITFSFVRNLHTNVQSTFPATVNRVALYQYYSLIFLVAVILTRMKWNLHMVLCAHCIHFFHCMFIS